MSSTYQLINTNLICKAIEELYYEEIIPLVLEDVGLFQFEYEIGCYYQFEARNASYDSLWINPKTLKKFVCNREVSTFFAKDFFIESQKYTKMSDETLAIFIEEMHQTLFADETIASKMNKISYEEVTAMNFLEINSLLPGHPKLILNKGRIGWGIDELMKYSPESASEFRLVWIAALRSKLTIGEAESDVESNLSVHLSAAEINDIKSKLGISFSSYYFFPVHPWQWSRYIRIQYSSELHNQQMIYLGEMGDLYKPQTSIRTLSNINNPAKPDIKLSLSILNTSSVRGISQKTIKVGHKISNLFNTVIENDIYLKNIGLKILAENSAINFSPSSILVIENLQYRYKELLGCIWRESVESKLEINQKALPTAALFYKHIHKNEEKYLVEDIIAQSGVTPAAWIREYFQKVVCPLYYLQVKYGMGLVAHGQNTIIILEKSRVKSLVIKDFHGDFRISNESIFVNHEIAEYVEKLPSHYLIHDLITGHFITTLRYISRAFFEAFNFDDQEFFKILGEVIKDHEEKLNLTSTVLGETVDKILVNKVRFVAGYADTRMRLKPMLGSKMENPLVNKQREIYAK